MSEDFKNTSSSSGLQEQASAAIGASNPQRTVQEQPQGFMGAIRNFFIDPQTGEISILKIGAMLAGGGLAGLLTSGLGFGIIPTIIVGAIAAFGASAIAPKIINFFTGTPASVPGGVRVNGATHLTPIEGYQKEHSVEIDVPGKSAKTTLTMPTVDETINPKPDIGLRELQILQQKAHNPDFTMEARRTAADDFAKKQTELDTWVTTLASLDQPFRRYNSEERTRVMGYLQTQFNVTSEDAEAIVPKAPEVPLLRGNNNKAMEALSPKLESFGQQVFGMEMFGQRWEDLSTEQQAKATEAWNHVGTARDGTPIKRSVIEKYAILNNWVNEQEYQFRAARLAAVGILREKEKDEWFPGDYNASKEMPIKALLVEDERGMLDWSTTEWTQTRDNLTEAFEADDYARVSRILSSERGRQFITDELRKTPEKATFQKYVSDPKVAPVSYADALIRYGESCELKAQLDNFRSSHLQPYYAAMETFQSQDLAAYAQSQEQFERRMDILKTKKMLIGATENGVTHIKAMTEKGFVDAEIKIVGENKLQVNVEGEGWHEYDSPSALTGAIEDHADFIRSAIGAARTGDDKLISDLTPQLDVIGQGAREEIVSLMGGTRLQASEITEETREATQLINGGGKPEPRLGSGGVQHV